MNEETLLETYPAPGVYHLPQPDYVAKKDDGAWRNFRYGNMYPVGFSETTLKERMSPSRSNLRRICKDWEQKPSNWYIVDFGFVRSEMPFIKNYNSEPGRPYVFLHIKPKQFLDEEPYPNDYELFVFMTREEAIRFHIDGYQEWVESIKSGHHEYIFDFDIRNSIVTFIKYLNTLRLTGIPTNSDINDDESGSPWIAFNADTINHGTLTFCAYRRPIKP